MVNLPPWFFCNRTYQDKEKKELNKTNDDDIPFKKKRKIRNTESKNLNSKRKKRTREKYKSQE